MQVGNFSLHVRKLRLAGLFVNRNNITSVRRLALLGEPLRKIIVSQKQLAVCHI